MKIKTVMYAHGCKEDSCYHFEKICKENGIEPSEEAVDASMYALYEIALDMEFDTDTGESKILGCRET